MNPDEHAQTIRSAPLPWRTAAYRHTSVVILDANNKMLFVCRPEIARVIIEAVNKLEVGDCCE